MRLLWIFLTRLGRMVPGTTHIGRVKVAAAFLLPLRRLHATKALWVDKSLAKLYFQSLLPDLNYSDGLASGGTSILNPQRK